MIWALYIKSISIDKYFLAAIYSVGIGICSVFMVHEIAKDILNSFPYLFGLFFGTYTSKFLRKK